MAYLVESSDDKDVKYSEYRPFELCIKYGLYSSSISIDEEAARCHPKALFE